MGFRFFIFLSLFTYMVVIKTYVFTLMVWLEVFILVCGKIILLLGGLRGEGGPLILIFIISFAVCEAVMALSCLVNISYSVENFNVKRLDIVKC